MHSSFSPYDHTILSVKKEYGSPLNLHPGYVQCMRLDAIKRSSPGIDRAKAKPPGLNDNVPSSLCWCSAMVDNDNDRDRRALNVRKSSRNLFYFILAR